MSSIDSTVHACVKNFDTKNKQKFPGFSLEISYLIYMKFREILFHNDISNTLLVTYVNLEI